MPVGAILSAAAPIAGTVLNVAQSIDAANRLKKDKEELSRLTPAFYKIQDEYFQNKNLAEQQAGTGLTGAAKDYLTTETSRGLSSSLGILNQIGGNPNDVAKLFDSYQKGINSVAAQDSEAQLNNIKYYMGVNKDLAGQKTTQWAINEYQPYQAKLKELTQRIAADRANIFGGASGAVGSLSALGTSLQNSDLLKSQKDAAGNTAAIFAKLFNNHEGKAEDPFSTGTATNQGGDYNWYKTGAESTPTIPGQQGTVLDKLSETEKNQLFELLSQRKI